MRGAADTRDGYIHTDSKTKIVTVLLYLNPAWAPDGGRLRLLRNGSDLEAVAAEVPPDFGTLVDLSPLRTAPGTATGGSSAAAGWCR